MTTLNIHKYIMHQKKTKDFIGRWNYIHNMNTKLIYFKESQ